MYAMFTAIIVPAAKASKSVLFVVGISILLSVILECIPAVKQMLSSGWIIIVCTIVASSIGAALFPVNDEEAQ